VASMSLANQSCAIRMGGSQGLAGRAGGSNRFATLQPVKLLRGINRRGLTQAARTAEVNAASQMIPCISAEKRVNSFAKREITFGRKRRFPVTIFLHRSN